MSVIVSAFQNCSLPGDRYRLQARMVVDGDWVDSREFSDFYSAEGAADLVSELNRFSKLCVYRAVLVSHV